MVVGSLHWGNVLDEGQFETEKVVDSGTADLRYGYERDPAGRRG